MKVLFISNYLDGTGWSHAGIDYILAMDAAGIDVVCRPLRLNDHDGSVPDRVKELQAKSDADCDICVQHALPHLMQYNGRFKRNIGLFVSETSNFRASAWGDRLNAMDEIDACRGSYVDRPISVIPHATDVAKFTRRHEPLESLPRNGRFRFYFIGEFSRRKNLAALLKAFHTEFNPYDPVDLVIKTGVPGRSAAEAGKIVQEFCDQIKPGLKRYSMKVPEFAREIILTERLTEEEIYRLHASCDCFVSASYAEAWGIPAFDAMGFGKTPVVTGWGGFCEYLDDSCGWMVPHHLEPCFGVSDNFGDLYTADEAWAGIDVFALRQAMRQAFQDSELRRKKAAAGTERAFQFSHESVGQLILKALKNENEPADPLAATS
jgi:glycosyltransferase involved in cell wall biosynthesis